jgi:hypothetical protein
MTAQRTIELIAIAILVLAILVGVVAFPIFFGIWPWWYWVIIGIVLFISWKFCTYCNQFEHDFWDRRG